MYEMTLIDELVKKLKDAGCPSERIAVGYPLKNGDCRHVADVVVFGPDGKTPVAIFELKSRLSETALSSAVKQLARCMALVPVQTRLYVVLPSKTGDGIAIVSADGVLYGESSERDLMKSIDAGGEEAPTYRLLVSGFVSKLIVAEERARGIRVDNFKLLTRCIGILLWAVFLIDFILDRWMLDWQNVLVLSLAMVVVVLPYYDLISVKGVSFCKSKKGVTRE